MKHLLAALLGLGVGLGLGLLYSWVIQPVQYTDTQPSTMRADFQMDYAVLVARTFAVEGDLERARERLRSLGAEDPAQLMTAFAQRAAAAGQEPETVRLLGALAGALGAGPIPPTFTPAVGAFTPPPTPRPTLTPEPTLTPVPTITPRLLVTRTPTPTPLGALAFVGQVPVCDEEAVAPLLQVIALDSAGEPVPGVAVIVEWAGGFDRFFTGLKPELGVGYGDFAMAPDTEYTVRLMDSPATVVTGVRPAACTTLAGEAYLGSQLLTFQQP